MKRNIIIGTCVMIAALSSAFLLTQAKASDQSLQIQGSLKTTEISINSTIAGKVKEVLVSEGDMVKAGDVLMIMDSDALLAKQQQAQAAVAAAQAQAEAADAQYQKAANGTRTEEISQVEAAYDLAKKTYERMKLLYEEGAVSTSAYDQANAQYQAAAAQYEMAQNGARTEDIAAAKSSADMAKGAVEQALAALAEVNSYLEDAVITAPMDGSVTSLNINPGELISTGMPLASMIGTQRPWVEVNVLETDLENVQIGAKVKVQFLAYPDEQMEGVIIKVNQKPDFATKRATNNNGEFDILSYGVKIQLPEIEKDLYPGMTVLVDLGKNSGQ